MSDVTVSEVLTDAMSMLGDPDGEISQELFADYETGYSELISMLLKIGAPEIVRDLYKTVPANTNVIFPSDLGVTDFAEPQQIWERGNVTTVAITNVTDGQPISVTTASAVGGSGGQVELSGIPGVPPWLNRDWYITTTGPTTFTLNGSIATGAGGTLAVSGSVSWSPDRFQKLGTMDATPGDTAIAAPDSMGSWRWTDRTIAFSSGASDVRQLWIQYLADETPPSTGTIGLLDGREKKFLASAAAAHFAPKRQLIMGPQCSMWAYGPSGEADGSGGHLRQLIVPILKQKQFLPRQAKRFRIRRGVLIAI